MSGNPVRESNKWDFRKALATAERIVKLLEFPQTGSLRWVEMLVEEYENLKKEIQGAFNE